MMIIARGIVRVLDKDLRNIIGELSQGSFFGEMALIHNTRRSSTIYAASSPLPSPLVLPPFQFHGRVCMQGHSWSAEGHNFPSYTGHVRGGEGFDTQRLPVDRRELPRLSAAARADCKRAPQVAGARPIPSHRGASNLHPLFPLFLPY